MDTLKNQIDNLRLLIESVETDLSESRERTELADTTHAWLVALRERIVEVEGTRPKPSPRARRS